MTRRERLKQALTEYHEKERERILNEYKSIYKREWYHEPLDKFPKESKK